MSPTDPEKLAPVGRVTDEEPGFTTALNIIRDGRARAWSAVNHELVDVYWRLGGFLSEQVAKARHDPILAPLVREVSWSVNLAILGHCETAEERAFTVSPALVARYETQLPGKALLHTKMDEIYDLITQKHPESPDIE